MLRGGAAPGPGCGLNRTELDALRKVCRERYDQLSSLAYEELGALDWTGADGHVTVELPNGMAACVEANEFDHDTFLEVAICAYLVAPTFGQRIGDGPSFCRFPDGRFEPDDGTWEADWP